MSVSMEGNRLSVDGTAVLLEKPILDFEELPSRVIVLLDDEKYLTTDEGRDRNILAIDRSGKMLWRIARSQSSTPAEPGRTAPFVGIDVEHRGGKEVLIAYDVMGCCYEVDPGTGSLSNPVLTK